MAKKKMDKQSKKDLITMLVAFGVIVAIIITLSFVYGGGEEQKYTYYRYTTNVCETVTITLAEVTSNDYGTLEECQEQITPGGPASP